MFCLVFSFASPKDPIHAGVIWSLIKHSIPYLSSDPSSQMFYFQQPPLIFCLLSFSRHLSILSCILVVVILAAVCSEQPHFVDYRVTGVSLSILYRGHFYTSLPVPISVCLNKVGPGDWQREWYSFACVPNPITYNNGQQEHCSSSTRIAAAIVHSYPKFARGLFLLPNDHVLFRTWYLLFGRFSEAPTIPENSIPPSNLKW